MRIPDWTEDQLPQPPELVNAILARRGGTFINLDKALLWSEPVAAGWNVYLKNVRTGLSFSRKLRELAFAPWHCSRVPTTNTTTTRPIFWRRVARRQSWMLCTERLPWLLLMVWQTLHLMSCRSGSFNTPPK